MSYVEQKWRIQNFSIHLIYDNFRNVDIQPMEFTLPPLTQESFSRWYNKKVPRNDSVDERIVYPGIKLHCSTKSRDLRSQIMPRHVFVTQETGTNKFHHKVLGSNNVFISLPKRLYSHCFRNINIHSIPTGNRIMVRLTETTTVTLPFIPDDFVNQKRSKRNSSSRSRPKREQKRLKLSPEEEEPKLYTGWVTKVMSPATESGADNAIDSFHLMNYIRDEIRRCDDDLNTALPNPFSGAATLDDIKESPEKLLALTTILQFIHHYAKHIL